MSVLDIFATFKGELVPDPRVLLCEVSVQGGALTGVADGRLELALYRFAAENGLGLEVQFLEPETQYALRARLPLLAAPEDGAEVVSEAVYGERLAAYERRGEFRRVATARDGYLGWAPLRDLGEAVPEATHRFNAPRGHVFTAPKVAAPRLLQLSYGVGLKLEAEEDGWSRVALAEGQGYVKAALLTPLAAPLASPVPENLTRFARRLLEAPYLWGGVTAWGCDCSGLVQTVFAAHGVFLPRDADQQRCVGEEVEPGAVQPADLLFFPGHVAISLGGTRFVHANATRMRVSLDDFTVDAYGRRLGEGLARVVRVLDE
jgi:hypothetical protein